MTGQKNSADDDGASMRHTLSVRAADKPLQAEGAPAAEGARGTSPFSGLGETLDRAYREPLPSPPMAAPPVEITWQNIRLAVGEGELTPADVLAGANAELRRRAALSPPAAEGKEDGRAFFEAFRREFSPDLISWDEQPEEVRAQYARAAASLPPSPAAEPVISTDGPHEISKTRKWLARQLLDSMLSEREAIAKTIYTALGHEADEPWDASHQRRVSLGMEPPYSRNALKAFEAADALYKLSGYPLGEGKQGVTASGAGVCGEGTLPSPSEPPRSAGHKITYEKMIGANVVVFPGEDPADWGAAPAGSESCRVCGSERWVCENHPEQAWNDDGCMCGAGKPCATCNPRGWSGDERELQEAADQIAAVRQQAAPEGWVLVPRQPTTAMKAATGAWGFDCAHDVWDRMVRAAPLPPPPSEGEKP